SSTATPPHPLLPLSLHDALPISMVTHMPAAADALCGPLDGPEGPAQRRGSWGREARLLLAPDYLGHVLHKPDRVGVLGSLEDPLDRKSTRLNSSHLVISYAVFCL